MSRGSTTAPVRPVISPGNEGLSERAGRTVDRGQAVPCPWELKTGNEAGSGKEVV